jgi:hypothetical protein
VFSEKVLKERKIGRKEGLERKETERIATRIKIS